MQTLLLNPSQVEEDLAGGVLTLGFLPSVERVSHLECRGTWSQTAFNQAVEIAVGGCKVLDEVMRGTLREAAAAVS